MYERLDLRQNASFRGHYTSAEYHDLRVVGVNPRDRCGGPDTNGVIANLAGAYIPGFCVRKDIRVSDVRRFGQGTVGKSRVRAAHFRQRGGGSFLLDAANITAGAQTAVVVHSEMAQQAARLAVPATKHTPGNHRR